MNPDDDLGAAGPLPGTEQAVVRHRPARSLPPATHTPHYRGVWPWPASVVCTCGWVQLDHRSRARAKRAFGRHLWAVGLHETG